MVRSDDLPSPQPVREEPFEYLRLPWALVPTTLVNCRNPGHLVYPRQPWAPPRACPLSCLKSEPPGDLLPRKHKGHKRCLLSQAWLTSQERTVAWVVLAPEPGCVGLHGHWTPGSRVKSLGVAWQGCCWAVAQTLLNLRLGSLVPGWEGPHVQTLLASLERPLTGLPSSPQGRAAWVNPP